MTKLNEKEILKNIKLIDKYAPPFLSTITKSCWLTCYGNENNISADEMITWLDKNYYGKS